MSGDHTTPSRDNPAHQGNTNDVFISRYANPHTAIPDWLVCTSKIRLEVRHMAAVIMILQKRAVPPTKDEIADVLGVETRTISRWLRELREAGCLDYSLVGKRRFYVFHEPPTINDPAINDRSDNDHMESPDHRIIDRWRKRTGTSQPATHAQPDHMNADSGAVSISDPPSGSGGLESTESQELPTTSATRPPRVLPEHITTETGKWLMKVGFNIRYAYQFQAMSLPVAQADYHRRRELGQGNGAIIQAWAVELPEFCLTSDGEATTVSGERRAELRAKYGDLFLFSGDELPTEGVE